MRRLLGVAAVFGLAALAFAGTAGADPYPPTSVSSSSSTAPVGGTVTVSSDGWAPGSQVTITLDSVPVVLGTLTADANGHIQGTFTIPAGTALGAHTIVSSGTDPSGAPRTLSQALTVVPAAGGPSLAFTGGSGSGRLAVAGVIAVLLGALLVGVARKRRANVPSA